MTALRLAIVGFGKIARDQHVGAIAATPGVALAAIASRNASLPDVPNFSTLDELLRDGPPIDAERRLNNGQPSGPSLMV